MHKTIIGLLSIVFTMNVLAVEPEYNPDSKVLSIPTVKFRNIHLYDATLKLNDAGTFDILRYSETPSSNGGIKCTEDKITLEKFNQITNGMTLEQVNSIIGCSGDLKASHDVVGDFYLWAENTEPRIEVTFKDSVVVTKKHIPSS
jgi:hypothetical protein